MGFYVTIFSGLSCWEKKKTTFTFLSSPYHLSPYIWTSAFVSLCWTLVSYPQPSLSGPLPELTYMCFIPRPWLGLCCDWASLRTIDQKCSLLRRPLLPLPTHQALAPTPAIRELATPFGHWNLNFQPPNTPLFFQIRVFPWSPQVRIRESPAALPFLLLLTSQCRTLQGSQSYERTNRFLFISMHFVNPRMNEVSAASSTCQGKIEEDLKWLRSKLVI